MKTCILVVDDDLEITKLLRLNLEACGYLVEEAADGETALRKLRNGNFDMVILDIMLSGMDGLEVLKRAREFTNIPILMLSARDTAADKAVGLGIGADDYITEPFSPVELSARVKAHLRRYRSLNTGSPKGAPGEVIECGPVRLDTGSYRAWVRGREVTLTAKEFELLKLFVSHPDRVFTKAQLFAAVWGQDYLGDDNTVMVHIRRLRSKIEDDPGKPKLIRTVWGIGYRFEGGRVS